MQVQNHSKITETLEFSVNTKVSPSLWDMGRLTVILRMCFRVPCCQLSNRMSNETEQIPHVQLRPSPL